jgi:multisubunit Na+/H+ antiporter MnhB subunit
VPQGDYLMLIGIGGLFALLGLAVLMGGKREEKDYYDSLSSRSDMREFMERSPEQSGPGALKVGGWIAIGVGLLMVAMGVGFWLWGS